MISLTVVILFFVLVFASLFMIFGTTRNSHLAQAKRHPHKRLTPDKKTH